MINFEIRNSQYSELTDNRLAMGYYEYYRLVDEYLLPDAKTKYRWRSNGTLMVTSEKQLTVPFESKDLMEFENEFAKLKNSLTFFLPNEERMFKQSKTLLNTWELSLRNIRPISCSFDTPHSPNPAINNFINNVKEELLILAKFEYGDKLGIRYAPGASVLTVFVRTNVIGPKATDQSVLEKELDSIMGK